MALEKITTLPNGADFLDENDKMLVSKEIGPGSFESQYVLPNTLLYDSGWKVIPNFNGTYGLANIATGPLGTLQPSIRIIDRTVFIKGLWILPLSSTANGNTLVTNYQNYPSSGGGGGINFPWLFEGAAGGFSKTGNGNITMKNPIIPLDLYPEQLTFLTGAQIIARSLNFANNQRFSLQSFIGGTYITNDGKLGLLPTKALQGLGNENFGIDSGLIDICSRYNNGDTIPDFSNYRSGFSGIINLREPQPGAYNMGMDIDTSDGLNLGGFYIRLNSFWQIPKTTPLSLIKAAFDAL